MTTYKARVYIDGLNFYHSIVGKIQNKEICQYPSLKTLCENKVASFPTKKHEFANINIEKIDLDEIHYFTAIVKESDKDLQKPRRHEEYIDALENKKENVKVMLGEHKKNPETGKLKEKQTDVNLATRFVYDTCNSNKKCNYAIIISNDTDFCGTIKFVRDKHPETIVDVWTVDETCQELRKAATICHKITVNDFIGVPQIANFGFDPRSVKKMP